MQLDSYLEEDPSLIKDLQLIKHYQIEALYHITKLSNLTYIFQYGLLSHKNAHSRVSSVVDISDSDVQEVRKNKLLNQRSLQEYVCLYFNPRNPMLFKRQDQQEDLVILGIEPLLLLEKNVYFSDGNAAAQSTKFYDNLNQLHQVNWEILRANFWSDQVDGKRIRCSEILIPFTVPVEKIKQIFCYNTKQVHQIGQILQKLSEEKKIDLSICLEVKSSLYF